VPDGGLSYNSIVLSAMVCWMVILLFLSSAEEHYKVMYFFMLFGIILVSLLTDSFRGASGVGITLISLAFTFLDPITAVHCICVLGVLLTIGVMFMYISPEIMLLFMTILLLGSYTILTMAFFALYQDVYLTAFMIPFMAILWSCVIRARPPLRV
jgi:hypothetical protein